MKEMFQLLTFLLGLNCILKVLCEKATPDYEVLITDLPLDKNETNFQDPEANNSGFTENDNINVVNGTDEHEDRIKILIFEGVGFRSATNDRRKIWENGVVPFEIANNYRPQDRTLILEAMRDFQNQTCIRFQRRRNEASYIIVMPGRGCQAGVGKFPTANRVFLARACLVKGIIIHELMHTLGFFHEHTRPDRDQFIRVIFDNITPGSEINFRKLSPNEVDTFNVTYDYTSVLHYGAFDFARDRNRPTIVPLQQGVEIGQRRGFSEKDIQKINLAYNCSPRSETNGTGNVTDTGNDFEDDDEVPSKPTKGRWKSIFGSMFGR